MVVIPSKLTVGVNNRFVVVNVAVPLVGLTVTMLMALPSGSESLPSGAMVELAFFGMLTASSFATGGWFKWSKKLLLVEAVPPASVRAIWLSLGGCESPVL